MAAAGRIQHAAFNDYAKDDSDKQSAPQSQRHGPLPQGHEGERHKRRESRHVPVAKIHHVGCLVDKDKTQPHQPVECAGSQAAGDLPSQKFHRYCLSSLRGKTQNSRR